MAQNEPKGPGGKQGGGMFGSNLGGVAPTMVTRLLEGINFPADKKRIEQHAQQNKTRVENSDEILGLLRQLPDKQYQGVTDITQAITQLKR